MLCMHTSMHFVGDGMLIPPLVLHYSTDRQKVAVTSKEKTVLFVYKKLHREPLSHETVKIGTSYPNFIQMSKTGEIEESQVTLELVPQTFDGQTKTRNAPKTYLNPKVQTRPEPHETRANTLLLEVMLPLYN